MKSIDFQQTSRQPATEHGGTEKRRVGEIPKKSDVEPMSQKLHPNTVLQISRNYFQAICGCGWTSTIDTYEHVDLLRAMHAHAVVTFPSYSGYAKE